jgi:sigma-B regulation protein RsbU (phosphoserine phosphatase)
MRPDDPADTALTAGTPGAGTSPRAVPAPTTVAGAARESFEDLYERAPCGYLTTALDGTVLRANATLCAWLGRTQDEIVGRSMERLLRAGSVLFYQTRFLPTLRLSGEVREVVLELERGDGGTLPALVNSRLIEAEGSGAPIIRTAVFDATGRRDYERERNWRRRSPTPPAPPSMHRPPP